VGLFSRGFGSIIHWGGGAQIGLHYFVSTHAEGRGAPNIKKKKGLGNRRVDP